MSQLPNFKKRLSPLSILNCENKVHMFTKYVIEYFICCSPHNYS